MLKKHLITISIAAGLLCCNAVLALPEGGDVVAGSATIQQPNSTTVTVNQSTDKAIINWNQFNIGANELTQFNVPANTSVTLNRVIGGSASQILGTLKSNGQLWLINPNGVVFGPDSQVNVAGIVASTMNITNENFLKGNYQLQGNADSTAKIVNQGNIVASDNGVIALLAPQIENTGVLSANLGTIALGTGNRATLNLAGNQLLGFSVDQGIIGDFYDLNGQRVASVSNTGQIIANGGRILVTAQNIDKVLNQSINTSGVVEANTERVINGEIVFTAAGDTMVTGNAVISAQGNDAGETGGTVEITGNRVGITDQATITTQGAAGGGKIMIGGDYHGANPAVPNATATYIGQDVVINASATQNGNGGGVVVWSDGNTQFYGNIFSQGGPEGGNGGYVETSGHYLDVLGNVNTVAPLGLYGSWLLDPADLSITTNPTTNVNGGGALFQTSGTPSNLNVSELVTALTTNTTVTVQTQNDAFGGGGNISLQTALDFTGSSNSTLVLTSYGGIILSAPITNSGSGTLNVTLNPGTGVTNILNMTSSGSINIKGTVAINTSSLNNVGVNLGSITAGSLNVVSFGSIGQNSGTSLNIGSGGTLFLIQAPAGSNDLTLTNTGNSFVGSILLNNNVSNVFRNVSINAGSGTLSLNQTNTTTNPFGSLTLAADAGSSITISQGSAYQVSGTATFFAGNGGTVNLSNVNNNLGTKTVIGNGTGANMGSVSITTGSSGINISQNAGTISSLSLTSGGAISEDSSGSNNLNVTGTTTLDNGNNRTITLNNTNNVFGTSSSAGQIIIGSTGATTGAVSLFTGPNTVNIDQKGTSIASLAITSKNGNITQPVGSDPLNILGATTLDMTNGNTGLINLNNTSNQFGGTVTIGNGSTNIGGVTLNSSGTLTLAQASTSTTIGALTATSSGTVATSSNIKSSSTINFTGNSLNLGSNSLTSGSDITLTQTGSNVGFVLGGNITPGGNLSVTTNGGAIQINAAIQVLNGNLSLNSQNGSINDNGGTGSIKVASPFVASFDSGSFGTISLTNPNNDFYRISASGSGMSFRDANDLGIQGIQTSGTLTIVAGGTVQFVNGVVPIRLNGFGTQTITISANQLDNQYTNGVPINLGSGPGSRWIIYLANLVGNNFGSGANTLVSNNQAIWGTSYPNSISQSGNRYVFATVEQLLLAPLSTIFTQSKQYGDTVAFPAPNGSGGSANYQVSGFVNAATYGNVFTQDTVNNITVDPALVAKTLKSTIDTNSTIPFFGNPNKKPPVFCIKDPTPADPKREICY